MPNDVYKKGCGSMAVFFVLTPGHAMFHDRIGPDIEYEIECTGEADVVRDFARGRAPGAYVWTGRIHSYQSYEGEWDAELDGEIRPVTDEEAMSLADEETIWASSDFYTPEYMQRTAAEVEARTGNLHDQVRAFHEKFGHAVGEKPGVPTRQVVAFRIRLIAEEFFELLGSLHGCAEAVAAMRPKLEAELSKIDTIGIGIGDFPAFIDALADLDYVVEGTRLVCGVDGGPIAAEVQRANMAKEAVGDLKKPTKPEGWKPPDIEGELIKQGWVK
jgi:predicted HAD superfamily Cof-like phosphohydrolase